jgi:hypothetical protein
MDLELIETGDGGDVVKYRNDLSVIFGFQNMPFLAMFGGNVRASTPQTRLDTEEDFSFWGNNLLLAQQPGLQFNSETERVLKSVAVNSSGRTLIEQAVNNDLKFMQDFAQVSVSVSIISDDRIAIGVRLKQPDNLQQQDFIYIWNATNQEFIRKDFQAITPNIDRVRFFDDYFDLYFE